MLGSIWASILVVSLPIEKKMVMNSTTAEQEPSNSLMFWKSVMFGCVFLTCLSRFPLPINALPHWLQPNGFSPVWERRCDTKWPFDIKSLGQRSQRKGRSALTPLLWLRWWNKRLPFSGNDLPHSSHAYGRSPVWQRLKCKRCYVRALDGSDRLCIVHTHNTHLIWLIKCSLRVNGLLQIVHTCGLSPEWCFKWLVRCSFLVNV